MGRYKTTSRAANEERTTIEGLTVDQGHSKLCILGTGTCKQQTVRYPQLGIAASHDVCNRNVQQIPGALPLEGGRPSPELYRKCEGGFSINVAK